MDKLVILDYCNGEVHYYNIKDNQNQIDDDYIESLGFNIDEVYWMIGNIKTTHHRKILK